MGPDAPLIIYGFIFSVSAKFVGDLKSCGLALSFLISSALPGVYANDFEKLLDVL